MKKLKECETKDRRAKNTLLFCLASNTLRASEVARSAQKPHLLSDCFADCLRFQGFDIYRYYNPPGFEYVGKFFGILSRAST